MASVFKVGGRRLRAALIAGGLVGALVAAAGGAPATAQSSGGVPFGGGSNEAQFSAHASGSLLHADVIDADVAGPRVVDAEVGFSNAAFNSQGVDAGVVNEMNSAVVAPAGTEGAPVDSAGKESYGKGSGVEVGLGSDLPDADANQIKLTQAAGASHPPVRSDGDATKIPNAASSGLVSTSLVDVPVDPLLFVSAARGRGGAVWNPNTCIAGQPISFGEGSVAQADVLDAGGDTNSNGFDSPVVTLESENQQQAAESQSMTYLIANKGPDGKADGTYGVVSETEMILAPITLADDVTSGQGAITIDIAGTWFLRVIATGKGPATVQYGVGDVQPNTPILNFFQGGSPVGGLTFQDIFGDAGLTLPPEIQQLLELSIGEAPRDIAAPDALVPNPPVAPYLTTTEGRAAVDVLRLGALNLGAPAAAPQIAGLRVGHMEAKVKVPEGGIKCQFPVKKEGPASVQTGQEFTWTITIPSDPDALAGVACKLTDIGAVDTVLTKSGDPKVEITSVSNGGSIGSTKRTASWSGLGSYDPNDPNRQPIVLTVKGIARGAGTFQNTVDVTATLGQCTGGGILNGETELAAFLARAQITGDGAVVGGAQIRGVGATSAPTSSVLGAQTLPTTGGTNGLFTGLGIAALLTAAGVYLFNKKAGASTA